MPIFYSTQNLGPDHTLTLDPSKTGILKKADAGDTQLSNSQLFSSGITQLHFSFTSDAQFENRAIIYVRIKIGANYRFAEYAVAGNYAPHNTMGTYEPTINDMPFSLMNWGGSGALAVALENIPTGTDLEPTFIFTSWSREKPGVENPATNPWKQNLLRAHAMQNPSLPESPELVLFTFEDWTHIDYDDMKILVNLN